MPNLNVVLNCANWEKSAELYKTLGLRVTREEMEGIRFGVVHVGSGVITLFPNESPWLTEEDRAWLQPPLGKGILVDLEVANVKGVWKKVQRSGWAIDQPYGDMGGMEGFMLSDPDGYVLSVHKPFPQAKPKAAKKRASNARATASRSKTARAKPKGKARRARK